MIVKFNVNEPVEVAVRYTDGKQVAGNYGEQWQFSLTSGDVMYVEPIVKELIRAKGIQVGECFFIEKRKVGRRNEWLVYRETEAPEAAAPPTSPRRPVAPATLAATLPERVAARNEATRLEQQLSDSITLVNARKAAAPVAEPAPAPKPMAAAPASTQSPADRWKASLLVQTNALTDVLADAMRHNVQNQGGLLKIEDVRTLMITSFIELSKRADRSGRAA